MILVATAFRSVAGARERALVWLGISLAVASHGVLDSFVTYGEGVQFFAPWSTRRYAAPWPFFGGGIVRDTVAFIVCFSLSRLVMKRRGFALPRALDPRFLRASHDVSSAKER